MTLHLPVLLNEFLAHFSNLKIISFIDGTVGAGGHAKALLQAHPEIESFIGIDRDPEALKIAEAALSDYRSKVTFIHGNFRDLKKLVPSKGYDGIFLDIGVSSMQLDKSEKGFSFSKEGPLDMRMDPESRLDAKTIVNTFSEQELAKIFWELGEEPRARKAAKAIVEARKRKKFQTTFDLCEALKPILTWKGRHKRHLHPMTLIFQALRIRVNDELKAIEEALPQGAALLSPGGLLGVISFQSLEDRIVKESFRSLAKEFAFRIVTKKPLIATEEETVENPRARSAKMRFIQKEVE